MSKPDHRHISSLGEYAQRLNHPDNLVVFPDTKSETYEPWSLARISDDGLKRVIWTEGIQKDRSHMREDYRLAIEEFFNYHSSRYSL